MGERKMRDFDKRFYMNAYGDLVGEQSPADHYIGNRGKYALYKNEREVLRDIKLIERAGGFDAEFYQQQVGSRVDALYDYLISNWSQTASPARNVDTAFLKRYYQRSIPLGMSPLVFHAKFKDKIWYFSQAADVTSSADAVMTSGLFEADWFSKTYLADEPDITPEYYYCTEGYRLMMNPSEKFNTRAYYMQYPDIAKVEMNPLIHFGMYGRKEGRQKFSKLDIRGQVSAEREKDKRDIVLVVCHEASRTGAPIVGLNLARKLSKTFRIVTLLLRGGALVGDFAATSIEAITSEPGAGALEASLDYIHAKYDVSCALINSIVSTSVLEGLVGRDIPCVTLIHEFSQYLRPGEQISRTVALSDEVIVPAEIIRDGILDELRGLGFACVPSNITISPQGQSSIGGWGEKSLTRHEIIRRLSLDETQLKNTKFVFGAGAVQPRKGVDLFIDAARRMKESDRSGNLKFIWVGGNYKPDTDYGLSVYLADQVRRSGLRDDLIIFDEQPNLQSFWALADVFFLSSRLDPYPNVALDALSHGISVVCFDQATGIVDIAAHLPELVKVAPYCDAAKAAELLLAELDGPKAQTYDRAKLADILSFDRYVASLEDAIARARRKRRQVVELSDRMVAGSELDADWMAATYSKWLTTPIVGLGSNIVGLARLASSLCVNNVPAASPSKGKICGVGEPGTQSGRPGAFDYLSLSVGEAFAKQETKIKLVAYVSRQEDMISLLKAVGADERVAQLVVLVEKRVSVDESYWVSGARVTVNAVSALDELEAAAQAALSVPFDGPVLLARGQSQWNAIDDLQRLEGLGPEGVGSIEVVLFGSSHEESDRVGRIRASQRDGRGVTSRAGGFPFVARANADLLLFGSTAAALSFETLVWDFFAGALFPGKELQWFETLSEIIAGRATKWAIVEPSGAAEAYEYDCIYGVA